MDFNKIIELASYTLPAIVTGFVAYRFFELHIKNNDRKRAFLLNKQAHKESLPIRLQAFERMTLFLERINLTKLLIRIDLSFSSLIIVGWFFILSDLTSKPRRRIFLLN